MLYIILITILIIVMIVTILYFVKKYTGNSQGPIPSNSPIPSNGPIPSNSPIPSNGPIPSNSPIPSNRPSIPPIPPIPPISIPPVSWAPCQGCPNTFDEYLGLDLQYYYFINGLYRGPNQIFTLQVYNGPNSNKQSCDNSIQSTSPSVQCSFGSNESSLDSFPGEPFRGSGGIGFKIVATSTPRIYQFYNITYGYLTYDTNTKLLVFTDDDSDPKTNFYIDRFDSVKFHLYSINQSLILGDMGGSSCNTNCQNNKPWTMIDITEFSTNSSPKKIELFLIKMSEECVVKPVISPSTKLFNYDCFYADSPSCDLYYSSAQQLTIPELSQSCEINNSPVSSMSPSSTWDPYLKLDLSKHYILSNFTWVTNMNDYSPVINSLFKYIEGRVKIANITSPRLGCFNTKSDDRGPNQHHFPGDGIAFKIIVDDFKNHIYKLYNVRT